MQLTHSRPLGHLLAILVSIGWGTTFVATKVLLRAFGPVEIMIFRFIIAWFVLFLCSPKPLKPQGFKKELPFIGAGILGLTLYFILENTALTYTLASNVGIIISAAPMFTALLMWICRRSHRPRPFFFIGFLIAMAGIVLVTLSGGETLDANPLGNILTLLAALSWGAYGVCIDLTQGQGLSDLQITRKVFFWGLVFSLPFIPIYDLNLSIAPFAAPEMLGCILYLGLFASAICFVAWNKATLILGPVAANVYIYIMPIITVISAALVLGEPITFQSVGAIALILLGLWLSQKGDSKKIEHTPLAGESL